MCGELLQVGTVEAGTRSSAAESRRAVTWFRKSYRDQAQNTSIIEENCDLLFGGALHLELPSSCLGGLVEIPSPVVRGLDGQPMRKRGVSHRTVPTSGNRSPTIPDIRVFREMNHSKDPSDK